MTVKFKRIISAIFAAVLLCTTMTVFVSATEQAETTEISVTEETELSTVTVDESEASDTEESAISAEESSVPDTPQDSNTNIGFWIGLGAVALGALVALVFIIVKKKNEDE